MTVGHLEQGHRYLFMGLIFMGLTSWTIESTAHAWPDALVRGLDFLGVLCALAIWYHYEYALTTPAHVRGAEVEDLRVPQTPAPTGHPVGANVRALTTSWMKESGAGAAKGSATPPAIAEITIGGISVPTAVETQHFLVVGAPGTGKTVGIAQMMEVVRKRNERAVIYDQTGEYLSWFARPGDVILNPLDRRGVMWVPWADAQTPPEYERLAETLVPESPHQPYWHQTARALLSALLADTHSMAEFQHLVQSDDSTLTGVLERHGLSGLEGSGTTLANIRSSLVAPTVSLRYLKDPPPGQEPFSIRKWAKEGTGWLWFTSRPFYHATLRPLISLWVDLATLSVMELPPDSNRRVWLFLDEIPTLQRLPALLPALSGGRKYGVSGVVSVQSIAQLSMTYGPDESRAILGMPQSQLFLRIPDPDTAAWASRAIGERHVVREVRGESNNSSGYGESVTWQHEREPTVMASEVQGLHALDGYLRVADDPTVKVVRLKPVDRKQVVKPYVQADAQQAPAAPAPKPQLPPTASGPTLSQEIPRMSTRLHDPELP